MPPKLKTEHIRNYNITTSPEKAHILKTIHQLKSSKRPRCVPKKLPPVFRALEERNPDEVTVVSAYFDLGRLPKTGNYSTASYMAWAQAYRRLQNPAVFFTDSKNIEKQLWKLREHLTNVTKVIQVDRKTLWSFGLVDSIRKIFSQKGYPKHRPNTVLPEYSCAQHAKFDCLEKAVNKNYFQTKYITWLDIGYFRYIAKRQHMFRIVKPHDFNETKVAMNQVNYVNMSERASVIVRGNHVWVGGGMVFGVLQVIKSFVDDYRRAVQRYLTMNIMNTDQQVIFAMNTVQERKILKPKVQIQPYTWDVPMDCWFYLGYSCYREILD